MHVSCVESETRMSFVRQQKRERTRSIPATPPTVVFAAVKLVMTLQEVHFVLRVSDELVVDGVVAVGRPLLLMMAFGPCSR